VDNMNNDRESLTSRECIPEFCTIAGRRRFTLRARRVALTS
jgi:hypothetical protein